MDFLQLLNSIDGFIWGPPLLVLLVGTGIYFTIRLGLIQIVKLPKALKLIFKAENNGSGDISSFGALCTALAATIGTGNIVGVATAIKFTPNMEDLKNYTCRALTDEAMMYEGYCILPENAVQKIKMAPDLVRDEAGNPIKNENGQFETDDVLDILKIAAEIVY